MSNTKSLPNQTTAVPVPTYRLLSALAVTTGALWTVGITVIATQADTDPVGAGYDAANRVLTVPLLLLVGYAVVLRRVPPGGSRKGVLAMTIGSVLLLAGNVLEFWAVLLTDLHTEKTALRLGETQAFWGSLAGWMIFLAGILVTVVAAGIMARAVGGLRGAVMIALAVVGLAATALWAVSPLLAGAAALAFAGWLIMLSSPSSSNVRR
jgi:hypothetical protein